MAITPKDGRLSSGTPGDPPKPSGDTLYRSDQGNGPRKGKPAGKTPPHVPNRSVYVNPGVISREAAAESLTEALARSKPTPGDKKP
ncbi:MAG: hypothetical protein ABI740_05090 [Alphaproteobacteria bacterium]